MSSLSRLLLVNEEREELQRAIDTTWFWHALNGAFCPSLGTGFPVPSHLLSCLLGMRSWKPEGKWDCPFPCLPPSRSRTM